MKISYDYNEMIKEIKEELEFKSFSLTDTIQVLRDEKAVFKNYKPIVDWYYSDNIMFELLGTNFFDEEDDLDELTVQKEKYELDKPHLETMLVANCLIEMEEVNSIF